MTSTEILKSNNIRPSVIRVMIYDFLKGTDVHPTVDEIYSELAPKVPTLSKTTVYNTVKLFADCGLSKTITIDKTQVRYDADITMHGHFMCEKCNRVYDFRLDSAFTDDLEDFDISFKEVYYGGVCRNCNKKI